MKGVSKMNCIITCTLDGCINLSAQILRSIEEIEEVCRIV